MADQTPDAEQELGFLAHLYELRDRLLRIVIAVGLLFLILMPFAQNLYDWLAYPLASQMPEGEKLVSIRPAGPFLVPFKLALLVAFLGALPYVLFQIWSFVAPGLYRHEKRLAVPMLISSTLLFYCGIAFAYFVLLPLVFGILPKFTPETATYMPDIGHYMDFVMTLFVAFGIGFEAFGIGFEMPVATILLIVTGMATRESLANKRPYVIVGAFIVGMLLTPPDVISQLLLAIPMWLLFEVGLVASVLFKKQIAKAHAEKEAREQAEREAEDAEYAKHASSTSSTQKTGSPFEAAKTAGAAGAAAQEDELLWDDDRYTYAEEVDPDNLQFEETDEYRPLTDEEMEAELARIEAESVGTETEDSDNGLIVASDEEPGSGVVEPSDSDKSHNQGKS